MKILWLSNSVLTDLDSGQTGTWLGGMAQRLSASGQVELCNIAMANVREPTPRDCPILRQWIVPASFPGNDGMPSRQVIEGVLRIINVFAPDLIHIWGVEAWWGLLNARKFLRQPVLLEMQGIKGVYSRVFSGGLTLQEQRSCRGFKEIVLARSIKKDQEKFAAWGKHEIDIIKGCQHIATQTPWVEAWVRAANSECHIYNTARILRQEFYAATSWLPSTREPLLFCSAAYPVPYKGLHDAIRATAILSHRFPTIRLRVAGAHQKYGLRQDGYVRWISKLCNELEVADRIDWLGPLNAKQIISELQNCSAFIMPSHIENCCNAMQEALYLGVPTVSAYAGGVPALAHEEEAALFYPPGDEAVCAYQVERVLTNQELAIHLSLNARAVALERNDPSKIITKQLEIYKSVIAQHQTEFRV